MPSILSLTEPMNPQPWRKFHAPLGEPHDRRAIWYDLGGREFGHWDWDRDAPGALQMLIEGRCLLVFNAGVAAPVVPPLGLWVEVDTALPTGFPEEAEPSGAPWEVGERLLCLWRWSEG